MRYSTRMALAMALAVIGWQTAIAQNNESDRNRQFAAIPNWTGIWEGEVANQLGSEDFHKAFKEAIARPHGIPVVAPPGILNPMEAFAISRTQLDGQPPYNAEWTIKYDRTRRKIQATPAGAVKPGSIMACSWGFPEIMDNPFDTIFQIFATPEETLFLFANGQARHLYTDRSHPKHDDLWPSALGNTVGHWEGESLVVDTIERRAGPFVGIPFVLSPDLSEDARFSEHFHMTDVDTIQDDMVIEDAGRLAHPWTVTLKFHRVKDLDRLIPTDCTENNRFQVVKNKLSIAPR